MHSKLRKVARDNTFPLKRYKVFSQFLGGLHQLEDVNRLRVGRTAHIRGTHGEGETADGDAALHATPELEEACSLAHAEHADHRAFLRGRGQPRARAVECQRGQRRVVGGDHGLGVLEFTETILI